MVLFTVGCGTSALQTTDPNTSFQDVVRTTATQMLVAAPRLGIDGKPVCSLVCISKNAPGTTLTNAAGEAVVSYLEVPGTPSGTLNICAESSDAGSDPTQQKQWIQACTRFAPAACAGDTCTVSRNLPGKPADPMPAPVAPAAAPTELQAIVGSQKTTLGSAVFSTAVAPNGTPVTLAIAYLSDKGCQAFTDSRVAAAQKKSVYGLLVLNQQNGKPTGPGTYWIVPTTNIYGTSAPGYRAMADIGPTDGTPGGYVTGVGGSVSILSIGEEKMQMTVSMHGASADGKPAALVGGIVAQRCPAFDAFVKTIFP
jgi:hypothetical protein